MIERQQGARSTAVSHREVTTRDGLLHRVPAGITRNHGSGCWTVTVDEQWHGTRSFGGVDTVGSLQRAVEEADLRRTRMREEGRYSHFERRERRHKRASYGEPGLWFEARSPSVGYFVVAVTHARTVRRVRFRVESTQPTGEVVGTWCLAVAARRALAIGLRERAPDRVWHPAEAPLPPEIVAAATRLAPSATATRRVAAQVRAAFRAAGGTGQVASSPRRHP